MMYRNDVQGRVREQVGNLFRRAIELGSVRSVSVRQIELFPAVKADLVRPALDGEHSTQVTVTAAKSELKNPTQRIHEVLRSRLARRSWLQTRLTCNASRHSLTEQGPCGPVFYLLQSTSLPKNEPVRFLEKALHFSSDLVPDRRIGFISSQPLL